MESFKNIPNKVITHYSISDNPYNSEITRTTPTAFVFLVDQSESMKWEEISIKGELKTKAEVVTDMINSILDELVSRCQKSEGIRDYFDVCLIGYGGSSDGKSSVLWEGSLVGNTWVKISELKENARFEKRQIVKNIRGVSKLSEVDVPYWITATANYNTPMLDAIKKTFDILKNWIDNGHEACFPPTVINITDGIYSDGTKEEMIQEATNLKALHTKDGSVLFLNCHITTNQSVSVIFPSSAKDLPVSETLAIDLFNMSSKMPIQYNRRISEEIKNENDIRAEYIGMGYNTNMDDLFRLIDIGTTQAK